MRTLAVISRKGGAGKTTIAVEMVMNALARGKRAVLADLDPQRSASLVLKRREDIDRFLVTTTSAKLFALRSRCERAGCDLLVIDTAPTPEADAVEAIKCADLCLAVARPAYLDLAAVAQSIDLVRQLQGRGMIVLNQCQPPRGDIENRTVKQAREALRFTALPVSPVVLRSRLAYQNAFSHGVSVAEYGRDPKAAAETSELFDLVWQSLMNDGEMPLRHLRTASCGED